MRHILKDLLTAGLTQTMKHESKHEKQQYNNNDNYSVVAFKQVLLYILISVYEICG
jgi:hypothetical protein